MILRIFTILKSDFCMTQKISGVIYIGVKRRTVEMQAFRWSDHNAALGVWVLTSGLPWVLEYPC
jgi:hypothetical protein